MMNEGKIANEPQRKRAQNFSEAEKMILINLVQQYKDIRRLTDFTDFTDFMNYVMRRRCAYNRKITHCYKE